MADPRIDDAVMQALAKALLTQRPEAAVDAEPFARERAAEAAELMSRSPGTPAFALRGDQADAGGYGAARAFFGAVPVHGQATNAAANAHGQRQEADRAAAEAERQRFLEVVRELQRPPVRGAR